MNKIEKLHESIRTLFRNEGEKFCYTPGEIERLVCSLNYKQLYSVLCDMAEPVFTCCAGGGICDSHQYHSTKLFPANATLIWSDDGEPLGDDNLSTSYSNELWLLEDMSIAAASCFRVLNSAASYITEYREYNCFNRITYKIISNRIRIRSLFFALFAHAIDSSADKAMLGWLYGAKTAIEIVETIKREMVTVSSKIHGKIPKKNISEIIERIRHPANVLAWRPLVRVRSEQKLI